MKKVVVFVLINLLVSTVYSQIPVEKVPEPVRKSFHAKFPLVGKVSWKEERGNIYAASYLNTGTSAKELFTKDGKWLEGYKEIPVKSLPPAVLKSIESLYKEDSLISADRVAMAGDGLYYDVVLGKTNIRRKVRFNKAGAVIKLKK